MSDDGRDALVIIAMIGAPFSPAYARARAEYTHVDPTRFSALNVAMYGSREAWALTEQTRVDRDARSMMFGASIVDWHGDDLVITIDEAAAPFGRRIRGVVRVHPEVLVDVSFDLDDAGLHTWRPIAPRARVEVTMDAPYTRWSGHGYVDTNEGACALESTFRGWTWSRARLPSGRVALSYDAQPHEGEGARIAGIVDANGRMHSAHFEEHALPRSKWGLARSTRSEAPPRIARSLEDTPFYARALLDASFDGEPARAMHEALSLDRFAMPWVRFLLPFRMRRA